MIKSLITGCLNVSGLSYFERLRNRENVSVLMYHGIRKDNCPLTKRNWLYVSESLFAKQIDFLSKAYDIVPLEGAHNIKTKKPKVVITFDDGYYNNYRLAYPILKKYNAPATIFLVTNTIDKDHVFWFDRIYMAFRNICGDAGMHSLTNSFKTIHPYMVDDAVDEYIKSRGGEIVDCDDCCRTLRIGEIEKMANSGLVQFGSHTHHHELLTLMNDKEVDDTLQTSYDIIKQIPASIPYFCYPNGFYLARHFAILRKVGFEGATKACSGFWDEDTPMLEIPRWPVGGNENFSLFKATVSGSLNQLIELKRKLFNR